MNLLTSMRYLVALHDHRHFDRAAKACHITQPALSNALRALERELGTPIVRRGRTYSGLTPEGEQVLASARRMLREHEALQQTLASQQDQPVGSLRLGVVPSAVPVATRFCALLQSRHPGIAPVLLSLPSGEIEAGLKALTLDLGLGFLERVSARSSGFQVIPQYQERLYLVTRAPASARAKSSPPSRIGDPLNWADTGGLDLCLLTPDMHNRSIVDGAFARAGVAVKPVMETNSVLSLALAVRSGSLTSVMPGALVSSLRDQPGLLFRPLVKPEVQTPVGFLVRREVALTRVQEAALALARDADWRAELAASSGSFNI
ncbi:LysR substrate-binding domain-containing protein [Hydrogenophaga luteola]|uniref:LysR substrate-binding domain-containing protein n=1 Tax=Hydrogenophaga luteola TaxID=1591122 RepID=A0ABV7W8Q2_9BURK